MSETRTNKIENVRFAMQCWKWPNLLRRLKESDTLIMDQDIYFQITSLFGKIDATFVEPEKAFSDIPAQSRRVLVFTRYDELTLVKKLRQRFTRKRIISLTYEVGPSSAQAPASIPRPNDEDSTLEPPTLILSAPGSDSEFLALMMNENGLGKPKEYFGQSLLHLVPALDGFRPLRFLNGVYDQAGADGLSMILQTDVLNLLFEETNLSEHRVQDWISKSNAKVIYFTRRDKMMHAALMSLMEGRTYRSVWSMVEVERQIFKPRNIDFITANNWMRRILEEEAKLEEFLSPLPNVKMITIEELVANPKGVIQAIAMFLEKPAPKPVKKIDYSKHYREIEGLADQTQSFRLELIDRLGLHVNSSGSWSTGAEDLLRKDPKKADKLTPEFVGQRS